MPSQTRRKDDGVSYMVKIVSLISGIAVLVSGVCTVAINLGVAYGQTSQRVETTTEEIAHVEREVRDNTHAINETAKAVAKISTDIKNIREAMGRIEKKLDED